MYVQAVVCFLFLAIKNVLECILCHFHVVSQFLLVFPLPLLMALKNALAVYEAYIKV